MKSGSPNFSVLCIASSVVARAVATGPTMAPTNNNNLTANGIKAGVAGYRSITEKAAWSQLESHIGWYSDYWPDTPDSGSVTGIGMVSPWFRLWGKYPNLVC